MLIIDQLFSKCLSSFTVFLLSCILFLPGLYADKVILKSGETLKGQVVSEYSDQILMRIDFSKGIREEKIILRKDIVSIEKTNPTVLAYQSLKAISIPENLLAQEDLQPLILRYKRFIRQNPKFESLSEAQKTLETLEADTERLKAGDIKINHSWIESSDVASQSYQVEAIKQWRRMNKLYRSAEIIPSLNTFAKLEKTYPGSAIFPQAVIEARDILSKLEATMNHQIRTFNYKEAEREKNIKLESESMAASIRAAREKEIALAEAKIERSKAPDDVFSSFSTISKKSMEDLRDLTKSENTRLSQLNIEGMQRSLKSTKKASDFLNTGAPESAQESIEEALIEWPENEAALHLQKSIDDALKAKAATEEAAAAAKAAENPEAAEGTEGAEGADTKNPEKTDADSKDSQDL